MLSLSPVQLALLGTALEAGYLVQEAGSVLAMRVAGLSGLRPLATDEVHRMVSEKPAAFAAAGMAAWIVAARGRRADEILAASLRPLRSETRANVLRLRRDD